ncbi:MAG: hypothetical protein ABI608_04880 [Rhizomicrobium sp.]
MASAKNPENEAEIPAPVPRTIQGQGGISHVVNERAGQQGATVKKAKMAPLPSAPPGLEQDNHGNAIPFEERTPEDQEKVRTASKS